MKKFIATLLSTSLLIAAPGPLGYQAFAALRNSTVGGGGGEELRPVILDATSQILAATAKTDLILRGGAAGVDGILKTVIPAELPKDGDIVADPGDVVEQTLDRMVEPSEIAVTDAATSDTGVGNAAVSGAKARKAAQGAENDQGNPEGRNRGALDTASVIAHSGSNAVSSGAGAETLNADAQQKWENASGLPKFYKLSLAQTLMLMPGGNPPSASAVLRAGDARAEVRTRVPLAAADALGAQNSAASKRELPNIGFDELKNMDVDEIDTLYGRSEPGPMPYGITDGVALFFPGTRIGKALTWVASKVWKGKFFGTEALKNRILGLNIIEASLSQGKSRFDGQPANIFEYQGNTFWPFSLIRDEIRQVGPSAYLGKAYARIPFTRWLTRAYVRIPFMSWVVRWFQKDFYWPRPLTFALHIRPKTTHLGRSSEEEDEIVRRHVAAVLDLPDDGNRKFHAKHLGIFLATFFDGIHKWPAVVRFSGAVGWKWHDVIADPIGMTVALIGAKFGRVFQGRRIGVWAISMTNSPSAFGGSQEEFVQFGTLAGKVRKAILNHRGVDRWIQVAIRVAGLVVFLVPRPRVAWRLLVSSLRRYWDYSPLLQPFWSQQYREIGAQREMKWHMRFSKYIGPNPELVNQRHAGLNLWKQIANFFRLLRDPDFFRNDTYEWIRNGAVKINMSKLYEDQDEPWNTAVDDPLAKWVTHPEGREHVLTIHRQELDEELIEIAERTGFNPGDVFPGFEPSGVLRRPKPYLASDMARNKVDSKEALEDRKEKDRRRLVEKWHELRKQSGIEE